MCRFWYTRALLLLFLLAITRAEIRQLPFCDETAGKLRSTLFVSTLDGKLTALDASQEGRKKWTLDFQTEPLLSSNIHRRDLNNNGQWVRLIPSLNGGLYKFDGENLEAVPVSVDQLLQASFRYSDDMIFSGGKETTTYGIASSSGKILYECKMSSCTNATQGESLREEDVLIVRRHQHTVRAGDSRTGVERWNFSVGQHDLTILPNSNSQCYRENSPVLLDAEIKAVVPDGLVVAFSKSNPAIKLWEYKFDSPVVSIWREDQVHKNAATPLKQVNIFDSQVDTESDLRSSAGPGIYLGMHERQLYIQENPVFQQVINHPKSEQLIKYPWRPHPAIDVSNDRSTKSFERSETLSTTALSVLYNSEYINGNGFYLFSKDQMQLDAGNQCNGTGPKNVLLETESDPTVEYGEQEETPVQVMIVSLWYWWKEVCIISITTAILLNFMLTQKLLNATAQTKDAVLPPLIVERHIVDTKDEIRKSQCEDGDSSFQSRYVSDYEPVDCLGRGGYGVVFEARNKIDDCNYAIKRITLPNRESARERVMREVKALAKLDHQNIVRYFNSWLECPPAGWQEEHDHQWTNHKNFNNSNFVTESSAADTSVHIDVPLSNPSSVDSACEAYELNQNNDDSFIMFEASSDSDNGEDDEEEENETSEQSVHLSISESSTDETGNDHSITFEECGRREGSEHSIVFEKSSKLDEISERKSQLILDLRRRKDSGKSKSSTKMFLYIQMQLCQRCSLREWLRMPSSKRDISRILNIFQQIVDAVEYIHLNNLIHRDLKPSNIFFAFDGKIKVGDFGLVTAMTEGLDGIHTPCNTEDILTNESTHTAHVGTHLYMSPEQMNGKNYNYKVDIYSLGIILFELLTPFSTEMERVRALMDLRKSFPVNFAMEHPSEHELLKMMLDENPEKRLTTIGIKARHPQLKNEPLNHTKVNFDDSKWHFALPQLSRHSSTTNSSGSDSWENTYA